MMLRSGGLAFVEFLLRFDSSFDFGTDILPTVTRYEKVGVARFEGSSHNSSALLALHSTPPGAIAPLSTPGHLSSLCTSYCFCLPGGLCHSLLRIHGSGPT